MEEIEKLYNVLIDKKLYSKSLEDFQVQFADPEYVDKVYNVVTDKKLYSKDKETFTNQYSSKKKVNGKPTVLESGTGGSDLSEDPELQTGRKIDTLSIQIADLEKQIKTEFETSLTEEEEKLYPGGKPAEKTPAMIELESLTEQRDALINTTEVTTTREEAVEALFNEGIKSPTQSQIIKKLDEVSQSKTQNMQGDKGVITQGEKVKSDDEIKSIFSEDYNDIKNLLQKNESFVVPKLNYLYNDQGFKFEESNILGQEIKVTARNGEEAKITISPSGVGERGAIILDTFIKKNIEESSALEKRVVGYEANDLKFKNEKEKKETIANLSKRENVFQEAAQLYSDNSLKLEFEKKGANSMSDEQRENYNERVRIHNAAGKKLLEEEKSINIRKADLKIAVGKYYDMQVEQGNFGLLMNYGLISGVFGPISEVVNYSIQAGINLLPIDVEKKMGEERYKNEIIKAAEKLGLPIPYPEDIEGMTIDKLKKFYRGDAGTKTIAAGVGSPGTTIQLTDYDKLVDEVRDVYSKDLKYGKMVDGKREGGVVTMIREDWVDEIAGKSISEQYSVMQREGFWIGAFYGLAESIPSLLTGPARLASLFALTSGKLDEEMSNDPDFNNISENEKAMFKMPVALIAAALENYGIRNVLDKGGVIAGILTKVLNKMPKSGTSTTFKEFVDQEIKSSLGKGLLVLGGAGLAEFETGGAQEFSDIISKEVYNSLKGKDLFTTPDGFMDAAGQILYGAAQEMVGGIVLGTMPAVAAAVQTNDFGSLTEQQITIFKEIKNDPTLSQSSFAAKLKIDINSGEITTEEAKQKQIDYDIAIGLANELTDGINNPEFVIAMNLKVRKKTLEERIKNKDENLKSVKNDKTEIEEINEKLDKIKTETNNVDTPSQKTDDVLNEIFNEEESDNTKESATEVFFSDKKTSNSEIISDNLIINTNDQPDNLKTNQTTLRNAIKRLAKTGASAIQKLFPETKIILHESTAEFERFAPKNYKGYYNASENVIHIDLNKAGATTVPHEIFHATLLNKIKTDVNAAKLAEDMMKSIRKVLPKNSPLARRIDKFAAQYDGNPEIQNEERLAELMGIMAADYTKLTKPQKNKVIKFLQDLANKIGLNINLSEFTQKDSDVVDLFNTLAGKISTGEAITETDVEAINLNQEEPGPIGPPTKLKKPKNRGQLLNFKDSYPLSLVTEANKIDIDALINDIVSKDQIVTFWVADQLGIGEVNGMPIDGGPSFAFAQDGNVVWASGKSIKALQQQLKGDYIFIISGSPTRSKLFNKSVYDIYTSKLGDYDVFKEAAMLTKPISSIKQVLDSHDSWESLRQSPNRKVFLNGIQDQLLKPNTEFHKYMQSINGFIEVQDLRDGFYKENNFQQNDIMLVYKYTGTKEGSNHSTYANEILGEVIGVPDRKINAADIIDVESKKIERKPRSQTSQVVAPYGLGNKKLKPIPKTKSDRGQKDFTPSEPDIKKITEMFNINAKGFMPANANEYDLARMIKGSKYEVLRSKYDAYGYGGGLYLKPIAGGPKYKPPKDRGQKDDAFYKDKVREAREKGIKDSLIYDFLRRNQKLPVKKIKELFKIDSIILGKIPESFNSIEGGAIAGKKLFEKIETKLNELKIKNSSLKNPLSEREITDKVFEYFMTLPVYKKASDKTKLSTIQAQMLVDLQKSIEGKSSANLNIQLIKARNIIRQRARGVKEVKKLQQDLINFMRRNLPNVLFTKSETIKLLRRIQAVNPTTSKANLENIMDEIMEVVVFKNNEVMIGRIDKLLNKKYQVVKSGRKKARGIDVDTNTRIQNIKNNLVNDKTSLADTESKIEELTKKLYELGLAEVATPETVDLAIDLSIALNYNKSKLMDLDDMYTTDLLSLTLIELETLIKGGNQELRRQIEEDRKTYRKILQIGYPSITGEKINMESPDYKEQLEARQTARQNKKRNAKADNVFNNLMISISDALKFVNDSIGFGAAEAMEGLMDRLDKTPGEMFGGPMQELFTRFVDADTRKFKGRMMGYRTTLLSKLKEVYGKNYEETYKNFQQKTNTFYRNKGRVLEAQKIYNENKTNKTKRNLNEIILEETMPLSQHEMANFVYQYKDPANINTFKNMFKDDYLETMQEMENQLDDRVNSMAEYLVEEYYPSVYDYYNSVYKKIYRTNMPYNKFYIGPLLRTDNEYEVVDLIGNSTKFNTQVSSVFTKIRLANNQKLKPRSIIDNMFNYTREMEYMAAHAESVRNMNKFFTNPYVAQAIKDIHGEQFYKLVSSLITTISSRGAGTANIKAGQALNAMTDVFIFSTLGLNPNIALKQLTSIPTFMNEIGPANWIKYSAKNKSEQAKIWIEVRENSVYMQDRKNDNILRTIETYNPETYSSFIPKKSNIWAVNFLMGMIKWGDKTAIMTGGLPNYSYYKAEFKKENPNATEQQAIDHAIIKFERDVKTTQQSQDVQDRDVFQNSNIPLYRQLNMYLTTSKQYLRKEIIAFRNLYRKAAAMDSKAGKGTVAQNLRTFGLYHFVMPVIFQYATLGLPGVLRSWRDDDVDDLKRAALLGNLNAIFLFGTIFGWIADALYDKPWSRKIPAFPLYEKIGLPIVDLIKALKIKDKGKRADAVHQSLFDFLENTGAPLNTTKRWFENIQKVIEGKTKDIGETILRLINFTEYQIKGPPKTKGKQLNYGSSSTTNDGMDFDYETDVNIGSDIDVDLDDIFN